MLTRVSPDEASASRVKENTRQTIAPLLAVLRGYPMLEEVREAEFYLHGRDFIHFHETPEGVIADVLLSRGRVSMPVVSSDEQAELLERIEDRLSSLEQHHEQRRDRGRGGKGRDKGRRRHSHRGR